MTGCEKIKREIRISLLFNSFKFSYEYFFVNSVLKHNPINLDDQSSSHQGRFITAMLEGCWRKHVQYFLWMFHHWQIISSSLLLTCRTLKMLQLLLENTYKHMCIHQNIFLPTFRQLFPSEPMFDNGYWQTLTFLLFSYIFFTFTSHCFSEFI